MLFLKALRRKRRRNNKYRDHDFIIYLNFLLNLYITILIIIAIFLFMNTPEENNIMTEKSSSSEMRDIQLSENLLRQATCNDTQGFLNVLHVLPSFDLTKIIDKKNYTC